MHPARQLNDLVSDIRQRAASLRRCLLSSGPNDGRTGQPGALGPDQARAGLLARALCQSARCRDVQRIQIAGAREEGVSRAELIRELIDRAIGGHPGADLAADLAAINTSFGILAGQEAFSRARDQRMDYLDRLADA